MKLNRAGIKYITYLMDEYSSHIVEIAQVTSGRTDIRPNIDEVSIYGDEVRIPCDVVWRGRVDDYITLEVTTEDFLSMDYSTIKEKYLKIREEKARKDVEEGIKRKKQAAEKEKTAKIGREKSQLKILLKKYPDIR